jgi:hypothetical protein
MNRLHLYGLLLGFAIAAACIHHGYDRASSTLNPLPRVLITHPD